MCSAESINPGRARLLPSRGELDGPSARREARPTDVLVTAATDPGRARLLPSRGESDGTSARREARPTELPQRRKPTEGVRVDLGGPTIVFVTVCTKDRCPWLACQEAHELLVETWHLAEAWLVGYYLLMPDHLHLFAAPRDLRFTIEGWLQFWKSRFTKSHAHGEWTWQDHAFHHRLRHTDSYSEKWEYVRENPLRAGLVARFEDWPYQGMIHALRW